MGNSNSYNLTVGIFSVREREHLRNIVKLYLSLSGIMDI